MTGQRARPSVESIYRALRERICLLDLPPGARLTEEALAAEFGVSRTPIRQVLDRLEHERLVDQRPGSGTTVAIVDTKELRDVWAVRLKLAELIGEFVRLPAPPSVLEQLDAIGEELRGEHESMGPRELGVLYSRYHQTVLEVFSNETLRRIYDQLYYQTSRVWLQFLPEMDLASEIATMAEEVRQTRAALTGSSGEDLAEVRSQHMRMLLDRFNQHIARPIG